MTQPCPLVLVEWDDSAQPAPSWAYLADFREPSIVKCVSVGWLIHDGAEVKALAPNMGEVENVERLQVSGVIRIPARCVTKMTKLIEPTAASSRVRGASVPRLASRLGRARKRQA